jgi:hypothetical protein
VHIVVQALKYVAHQHKEGVQVAQGACADRAADAHTSALHLLLPLHHLRDPDDQRSGGVTGKPLLRDDRQWQCILEPESAPVWQATSIRSICYRNLPRERHCPQSH